MTILVLLILAVIWAAVLIPPMLGARAENRPADSIGDFRRQLHVLRRTSPTAVVAAHTPYSGSTIVPISAARPLRPAAHEAARRARTQKRRRDVFYMLLSSMAGTFVLGLVPSLRVLWGLHLVLDAAFAAYVVMLVHARNLAAEREMKLRFLPTRPEPALLLRRTGN